MTDKRKSEESIREKINLLDSNGRTALDHAAYHGHIEALGPLLDMGARVDSDNPRDTPLNSLIFAACNGKLACAKYLIDNGGDLLKNTIECKGLFPSPMSPENIQAARALQISALNGYPEPLISLIIATKKAAVLAGPSWAVDRTEQNA